MSFPSVTIYTTKSCGYCKATKELLDTHKVPYSEVDVGANRDKAREMIEVSGQMGVPVLLIGDQVVVGYDKQAIATLLNL